MAVLIILLKRKNAILKHMSALSDVKEEQRAELKSLVQGLEIVNEIIAYNNERQEDLKIQFERLQVRIKANYKQHLMIGKLYSYLYRQLEFTNRAISPTLTAFRYRCLKQEFNDLYEDKIDGNLVINTADDEMIDDNINMIDCNFTEEIEEWKEMKNGDNVIVDLIN